MDQSYNPNLYFPVASDLYLSQDITLLSQRFKFSKNVMLSFIDKVTNGA